jgi:hypothetical protein
MEEMVDHQSKLRRQGFLIPRINGPATGALNLYAVEEEEKRHSNPPLTSAESRERTIKYDR